MKPTSHPQPFFGKRMHHPVRGWCGAGSVALLALALTLSACGGTPVVSPDRMPKSRISPAELSALSNQQLGERRADLAQQRAEASAKHTVAEHTCWQRFAVTNCINTSARERREVHDQLRADDIALEDEQRKRKLERANERLETKQTEMEKR